MVILSVAVVSKSKTLVARQFVELTKMRIEGLLSAFLKLIEKGAKDHTYIETENVRYVYQPIESLYLIVITNRQSNILEDIETLRLFAQIVQENCQVSLSEESIISNAFSIIFAFDEVISFGYRESVSLSQIKSYVDMDSHEEKLQTIIKQNKENEEKERRKQITMKLDKEKAKANRSDITQKAEALLIAEMRKMFVSTASRHDHNSNSNSISLLADSNTDKEVHSNSTSGFLENSLAADEKNTAGFFSGNTGAPSKGLQLGKKKHVLDSNESETGIYNPCYCEDSVHSISNTTFVTSALVNPFTNPVEILIEEKINGALQTEGGLNDMEIQGMFQVKVLDSSKADFVCFKITPEPKPFKFRVHPNLNKNSQLSQNILEPRDASRAFRANVPTPLLKWRLSSKSEDYLPLNMSCWPTLTPEGITLAVEIELFDLDKVLNNVHLQFMCPSNFKPKVLAVHPGTTEHDGVTMHWKIPIMDRDNATGMLELTACTDTATILPFTFECTSNKSLCDIDILECYHQESNEPIKYDLKRISRYSFTVGSQ